MLAIERASARPSPPGKSVRPTLPANSVSPEKSCGGWFSPPLRRRGRCRRACARACGARSSRSSPASTTSPSSQQPVGAAAHVHVEAEEPLPRCRSDVGDRLGVVARARAAAHRSPRGAPCTAPRWSKCPWVRTTAATPRSASSRQDACGVLRRIDDDGRAAAVVRDDPAVGLERAEHEPRDAHQRSPRLRWVASPDIIRRASKTPSMRAHLAQHGVEPGQVAESRRGSACRRARRGGWSSTTRGC